MSERKIRVGELIQRELSNILHSRWRTESVAITLTGVDMSPDLKSARVFYSVIGGRDAVAASGKFLMSVRNELRFLMGKKVILKYTPSIKFVYDPSVERGMRLIEVMDEIAESEDEADLQSDNSQNDCDGSQHDSSQNDGQNSED